MKNASSRDERSRTSSTLCMDMDEIAENHNWATNGARPISDFMAVSDKALGATLLAVAVAAFTYYSVWTLVLPFVEQGHPLHRLFPEPYYALAAPLVLLVVGLASVASLIAIVMIKAKAPRPHAQ